MLIKIFLKYAVVSECPVALLDRAGVFCLDCIDVTISSTMRLRDPQKLRSDLGRIGFATVESVTEEVLGSVHHADPRRQRIFSIGRTGAIRFIEPRASERMRRLRRPVSAISKSQTYIVLCRSIASLRTL